MRRTARTTLVLVALAAVSACGGDNTDRPPKGPQLTPTPLVTATPPPQIPCPEQVTYIVQGDESDVDAGWTGIYFDQHVGTGGSLTFAVDCPGEFLGGCGQCPITGPIASTTVVDNHRCQNASEITCTSDSDCPGSACVFFFGSAIPISGGGFPVCITNHVTNQVTGTIVPELGSGVSDMDLLLAIHTGLTIEQPCPICNGPDFNTTGTCEGGPRDGQPCTVHGTTEIFGNTSFDCPPNPSANIGNTEVPIDLTTGERTLQPTADCTGAGATDLACYCQDQVLPNACLDLVCTVGADGEGSCGGGPTDQRCEVDTFRSCDDNGDCPGGDPCVTVTRKCSGQTDASGNLTGPFSRTGFASTEEPIQVGVFCINATSSSAINTAAGLPGPAGVRLPTSVCIFPTCPPEG